MVLFDGWRASRTLSNWVTGRLISASRELMLTERGDLDSRLDLRSFGVAVVAVMILLVGLSLAGMAHVVIPMVVEGMGVGLILMEELRSQSSAMLQWRGHWHVCAAVFPSWGSQCTHVGVMGLFSSVVVWEC